MALILPNRTVEEIIEELIKESSVPARSHMVQLALAYNKLRRDNINLDNVIVNQKEKIQSLNDQIRIMEDLVSTLKNRSLWQRIRNK